MEGLPLTRVEPIFAHHSNRNWIVRRSRGYKFWYTSQLQDMVKGRRLRCTNREQQQQTINALGSQSRAKTKENNEKARTCSNVGAKFSFSVHVRHHAQLGARLHSYPSIARAAKRKEIGEELAGFQGCWSGRTVHAT